MDILKSLNLNSSSSHPVFDPTFLNLEYIFNQILNFIHRFFGVFVSDNFILFLKVFFSIMTVYFVVIIGYALSRISEINKKEEEHLEHEIEEYAHKHSGHGEAAEAGGDGRPKNQRWINVLNYLSSMNPSDWKLAVMEADSMLENLTDQLELNGENLGERLKAANKEKFKSLDDAWGAHIVRNKIAHEGSSFDLSQHEANRVVVLYENVFREFGYI